MVRASLTLLSGTKDARLSVTVQAVAGKGEAGGMVTSTRERGVSLFRFGRKSVEAAEGAFVGGVLSTPRFCSRWHSSEDALFHHISFFVANDLRRSSNGVGWLVGRRL